MSFYRRYFLLASCAAAAGLLAACGGGGGGGTTSSPGLPPAPAATASPTPPAQTPNATSGIAYLPGGVGANDPYSLTVVQFEDTLGNVLSSPIVNEYGSGTQGVPMAQIAMGTDGSTAVALTQSQSLLPDSVVSASIANAGFAAAGNAFDLRSTLSQPYSVAVMPDNGTVVATGGTSIAEVMGLKSGSPTVQTGAYPVQINPGMNAIAVSPDGKTLITRGQSATLIWSVSASSDPSYTYRFSQTASDSALDGSVSGRGDMAFDPADSSKALFGWMSTGDELTLEGGMPSAPVEASTIHLGGSTLYSIAFTPDGKYAVVGSHDGIYVVSGFSSDALLPVAQNGTSGAYTTAFTGAGGAGEQLTAVYSIGVSNDGRYVEAVAAYSDTNSDLHEALLAVPIDSNGKLGAATTLVSDLKTRSSMLGADGALFR